MASVLYDLRMICWLFVWWKSEAVRSGVGVVKNLEPEVVKNLGSGSFRLKGRVICSPQSGTKYGGCSEKTRCHKEKRHPMFKSDAPFWLSCKVFPDEISPRLHLLEALRVGQNRYIRQMSKSNATWHYNPQC